MEGGKQHWEKIYSTKTPEEFSWFQRYPKTSIDFIESFKVGKDAAIIDIGGGDSLLVDALIERGYINLHVLDISEKAIERAKARLGNHADRVNWIVSDVLDFRPEIQFDVWHDRAAFHFLVRPDQVLRYVQIAESALKDNGYMAIGTFSDRGPDKCSGLPVKKYSEELLSGVLHRGFLKIGCIEENHETPFHTMQSFLFCRFMHKAA